MTGERTGSSFQGQTRLTSVGEGYGEAPIINPGRPIGTTRRASSSEPASASTTPEASNGAAAADQLEAADRADGRSCTGAEGDSRARAPWLLPRDRHQTEPYSPTRSRGSSAPAAASSRAGSENSTSKQIKGPTSRPARRTTRCSSPAWKASGSEPKSRLFRRGPRATRRGRCTRPS